ncbi:two-component system phosphate regulon sensor histidine kinase PhoR [Mycoplana sp. BE70]|uniref:phosphate regulon sensor histidine kinase PhoR n=1 Tax=Mycoplana sp. BE70 TaxID=2817775 RepID=UPI0028604418|nr:phosphate regulon sensor histidine kinase PhoR [Mycoplana sp. BE70]MDR6754983.1 two-component system phosphate regulon sensor histidine kinase PhoR [Mycoplana sp. BE70]
MKVTKGVLVETRGSTIRWLLTQLWDERVLLAAVVFTAFLMWMGGVPAGWVVFAAVLLVLAGFARADRLEGKADAVPVAMARSDANAGDGLASIAVLIDALDMPVLVVTADETVKLQNRAATALFGPIPRNADLAGRIRAPGILDMAREVIAIGQTKEIEHSERLPAETVYIVRAAPMPSLGQRLGGGRYFLISFRDVSQARRIEQMRSDFVANASHELRTPLASLRGFIETLQGPAKADEKAQERFLGIMHEQATRMSRLVDDLLSLSRLELKSNIVPDEMVDLKPLLGHVRDSLQPFAAELGVEIHLELPEQAVEVAGDRDELTEVFENLLENACKYGQEGKRVEVRLSASDAEHPEVTVMDFGSGIPPEHVPRLTERFYRVNVEASRSKKGTGLGLAIVKHILTRHRARLVVKSEVGKGTVFTVKF